MSVKRIVATQIAVVGIASAMFATGLFAADNEDPLIQKIRQAWQARQDRFKTFVIEWDQQETTHRGVRGSKADVMHHVRYRLSGDGDKLRMDRNGMKYDIDKNGFVEQGFVRVFDGKERREVFQSAKHGKHPGGFINDIGVFDETDWKLQPAVWMFRPMSPAIKEMSLEEWKPIDRQATVNGVPCRILERYGGAAGYYQWLYVADSGDHRITRRERYSNNEQSEQVTADYNEKADFGFVVKSWTYVKYYWNGRLEMTIAVPKVDVRPNDPVDAAEFEFRFTPGTTVVHQRTGAMAVVRTDGSFRPVSHGELAAGMTWEKLMQVDPLPDTRPLPGQESNWFRYAIVGLAALVVVGCAWRWRANRMA